MLVELKNINKTYITKTGVTFRALSNVSLTLDDTGLVFLLGRSGSGKSTLLNILGALDRYDSGEMWVGDKMTKSLSGNMLDYYRNTMVGFVFQEFNLIDSLSVMDNVRFALDIRSRSSEESPHKEQVLTLLDRFGIKDKARVKARNLSGGQRQRVAIARALIKEPQIILADEPTGSLDSATGEEIIETLKEISKTKLVIVVTHDAMTAAKYGDRIIEMKDGEIFRDVKRRMEGESLMAAGVDIVSKTLVRLIPGAALDTHFARQVNEIISESGRKTYLAVDSNGNRMKALFPNLRDAVTNVGGHDKRAPLSANNTESVPPGEDAAQQEFYRTDELLDSSDFIPFTPKDTVVRPVQFKRSRVSFFSTLKMGIHNLSLKKFRLVMILIVTILSFTMFGALNTLSSVRVNRSLAKSIAHDKVRVVSVSKNMLYSADGSDAISDSQIASLESKYKKISIYPQRYMTMNVQPYSVSKAVTRGYYFDSFVGVTQVDDMEKLGLNVVYGTSEPKAPRNVIISDYAARALISGETFDKSPEVELSSLIGRSITLNSLFSVTICGIYETGYAPFTAFSDKMAIDSYNHVFQLFAGLDSGFISDYYEFMTAQSPLQYPVYFRMISGNTELPFFDRENVLVSRNDTALYQKLSSTVTTTGMAGVTTGQRKGAVLFLPYPISAEQLSSIDTFNQTDNAHISMGTSSTYYMSGSSGTVSVNTSSDQYQAGLTLTLSSADYYIAGYIMTASPYKGIALDDDTFEQHLAGLSKTRQIMIALSASERENAALIQDLFNNGMQINADFSYYFTVYMAVYLNFEALVVGATVLLSILATLLMFNFISTSIRLTRRHIGILRALGVKKSHTFLVYILEGFVIGLITFAAAVIALLIIIPIINASLSKQLGVYVPIMVFNPVVVLTMAALSFGISTLAIFIPWFKFVKISPVEAISGREQ